MATRILKYPQKSLQLGAALRDYGVLKARVEEVLSLKLNSQLGQLGTCSGGARFTPW
jgi:hypothetical protein